MRKNSSEFITGFASEAGTFRINKDFFAYAEMDDVACYIISDGIDSDEDINSAELVSNYIFEKVMKKPVMSKRRLKKYINEAHKLLNSYSKSVRLKASLTVLLTDYSKMIWAGAGNTRLYHFRKGGLNFRTKDQSISQMMADAGQIAEEEISCHEERNNLTNYLGQARGFKPFMSKKYKLTDKDVIVLCSVGFWENIYSVDMVSALKDAKEPADFIQTVEDDLLSRQNKVLNNYTVAAIFANKVFKENLKDDVRLRIAKKVAAVLIPVVLVVAGFFILRGIEASKARKLVVEYEENGDKYLDVDNFNKALESYEQAEQSVKKINDGEKRGRIETKRKIADLIVKGDEYFQNKDFENSKLNYMNARTQAEFELEDVSKKELKKKLDEKIRRADNLISVVKKGSEGDKEFADGEEAMAKADEAGSSTAKLDGYETAKQHFNNAISIYKETKELSDSNLYYDMVKDMESKIKDTEAKIKELEQGKKEQQQKMEKAEKAEELLKKAESFVKDGDKLFKEKKYNEAKVNYNSAIEIYKELKENSEEDTTQKIHDLNIKIVEVDNKIKEQEKEDNTQIN
jgi:serine/threonine protein phosphatase PrpC